MSGRSLQGKSQALSYGALAFALLTTPALAQPVAAPEAENDDIVVTAQRREEASLDVPITVTTLSSEQLTTANVDSLADTARLTPALRFDSQGPAVQPTIRGVGTAVTTSGGGPNVGVYVDGFFSSNTYVTDFDLMNVRNIQVLKGPQGTLFGRNTTGGAILVTTSDPSTETGGAVSASYGRFNEAEARAYFTTGLGENIAWDVEGQFRSGDGHVTNLATNDDEAGAFENWSARTGLLWDFSPTVSLLLRYTHAETDDPNSQLVNAYVDDGNGRFYDAVTPGGLASYGVTYPSIDTSTSSGQPLVHLLAVDLGAYVTTPGQIALPGRTSFNTVSDSFQATLRADLGFADLTSYTQYRTDDSPYYGDLDATALPFFDIFVGVEDETVSQEFVLNSNGDGRLQWTAGLAYFSAEDIWDVDASFNAAPYIDYGGSGTRTTSYAVFADATYQFAERWFVTLGARYSYDEVTDAFFVTNPNTPLAGWTSGEDPVTGQPIFTYGTPGGTRIDVPDLDNDAVTPRLVLRYEPNDVSSIYASYTEGYKAGILNVGGLSVVPVDPEHINAYEIGYKFDNRIVTFDTAAYFYDYEDLQFSSFQNGAAQIRNAEGAEVYGLEAQARIRVTDDFAIFGGFAYMHAEYTDFDDAPFYTYCDPTGGFTDPTACVLTGLPDGAITQITQNANGRQMQRAPEFTMNLGASYDIQDVAGGVVTLSGNVYYTSDFYFDANEQFHQPAYEVVSLRAQWTDPNDRFTIAAFGDNLTNERYQTQVLFNTLGIGSVWSAPSTYGVSISARY